MGASSNKPPSNNPPAKTHLILYLISKIYYYTTYILCFDPD